MYNQAKDAKPWEHTAEQAAKRSRLTDAAALGDFQSTRKDRIAEEYFILESKKSENDFELETKYKEFPVFNPNQDDISSTSDGYQIWPVQENTIFSETIKVVGERCFIAEVKNDIATYLESACFVGTMKHMLHAKSATKMAMLLTIVLKALLNGVPELSTFLNPLNIRLYTANGPPPLTTLNENTMVIYFPENPPSLARIYFDNEAWTYDDKIKWYKAPENNPSFRVMTDDPLGTFMLDREDWCRIFSTVDIAMRLAAVIHVVPYYGKGMLISAEFDRNSSRLSYHRLCSLREILFSLSTAPDEYLLYRNEIGANKITHTQNNPFALNALNPPSGFLDTLTGGVDIYKIFAKNLNTYPKQFPPGYKTPTVKSLWDAALAFIQANLNNVKNTYLNNSSLNWVEEDKTKQNAYLDITLLRILLIFLLKDTPNYFSYTIQFDLQIPGHNKTDSYGALPIMYACRDLKNGQVRIRRVVCLYLHDHQHYTAYALRAVPEFENTIFMDYYDSLGSLGYNKTVKYLNTIAQHYNVTAMSRLIRGVTQPNTWDCGLYSLSFIVKTYTSQTVLEYRDQGRGQKKVRTPIGIDPMGLSAIDILGKEGGDDAKKAWASNIRELILYEPPL